MESEKESMRRSANYYIDKVTTAKTACEDASRDMCAPFLDVRDNWSGKSGDAMVDALDNLQYEIIKVHARLVVLEANMKKEMNSIYQNWPEEKTES